MGTRHQTSAFPVEHNASRADVVARAEEWKWSSVPAWQRRETWLYRGAAPVRRGQWLERVNEPVSAGDLKRPRHSVARGRPLGGETWTEEVAKRLGLDSCLRPPGRPKKHL
jgi:putative transposase